MDLTSQYFDIFRLPINFEVDQGLLKERYLELQQRFHPDRYAGRSVQEQRLAVQSAAALNQAFDVLKSPVKRAQYLLELSGVGPDESDKNTADTDFLMTQMSLREDMADIPDALEPFAALAKIESALSSEFEVLELDFASAFAGGDLASAGQSLVKMQFYAKLLSELEEIEENLEDSLEGSFQGKA